MRKIYFFMAVLLCCNINVNAQFVDDMEYPNGIPASSYWWNACLGCEPLIVGPNAGENSDYAGYIDGSGIDPILLLGDKILGSWGLKFSMKIPSGKIGYWNIQGQEIPGVQWVIGNINFGNGILSDDEMTGRIDWNTLDETDDTLFQFPKDEWFEIIMNFDFNSGASVSTWTMWVDGVEVVSPGTPFADKADPPVYAQALGGINLYSVSNQMEMYIDNFNYINDFFPAPLSVEDLNTKGFAAYPNPVNNVLNVRANEPITSVAIFNVLGQQVYSAQVDALNTTIDMSRFDNGAYFVKAVIGTTEGTIKVLK